MGLAELKALLLAALAAYLAVAALVWFSQESLMFFPRAAPGPPVAPAGWRLEPVEHRARDGTTLRGALLVPPGEGRHPLVIYYGGNAEEVTSQASVADAEYGRRAVLLVNYRGYGGSEGRPGEAAMVADALELHDRAAAHPAIDAARVALHGRSLGSGVAVQVAAARPVRCVVLTSPFASALDVARQFYPWLPVALLMRHRFDSAAHAPAIRAPLLVAYADGDDVVGPHHSEKLASLWGGPVERVALKGFGHNDLHLAPRYGAAVREFLDRCLAGPAGRGEGA